MPPFDAAGLATTLRREVRATVLTDAGGRALYTADASNYRVVPDLVVLPRDVEALVDTLAAARAAGAPVALRGGGTSMAGNDLGGVVVDVSRHLTRILDIDAAAGLAVVEPGVVLTDLLAAVRPLGLAFGADPSSASRATLGGMVANNACGAHSVAWGTTSDNVRGLEVVTGDGRRIELVSPGGPRSGDDLAALTGAEGELTRRLAAIGQEHALLIDRRFGTFSRQISGYALQHLRADRGVDLPKLLCGSEGTLATTLRATVALARPPAAVVLLALGFPDSTTAADCVPHVLPYGPLTMESINAALVDRLPDEVRTAAQRAGLPPGKVWLLVEVGGESPEAAASTAAQIAAVVRDTVGATGANVVSDPAGQAVLWRCRRDGTGLATRRADGAEAWGGWEDAAVPPGRLGDYLRSLDELMGRYHLSGAAYGHFGEGCMHMRFDFDLMSDHGVAAYRSFVEEATDLVVGLGGSVSGEHGDGRARGELVARMYGADAMGVFAEVKRTFDPAGLLNPGIVVDPAPLDVALRHNGRAHLRVIPTEFSYAADGGSFAAAQRRCVGVGKCRQSSGGVMCPSYQVTREEKDSTRGRAHLLWEMVEGDLITDGWRSTEVRDALDLCLSCKGCLGDCPVNVDMATYKAEFTHHHYAGRPWARPRSHWSMGWLPVAAAMATRAPRLVNRLLSSPLAGLVKKAGGIAPQRDLPVFAEQTLAAWMAARESRYAVGPAPRGPVVLWPDTFTNHLSPEVGRAAVLVLEDAGFEVRMPSGRVCCGLTWVSTGQLGVARRVLQRSLGVVAAELRAGIPVVALEPSCTAMLRHDAPELLGAADELATLGASGVLTLAELLRDKAPDWSPPRVGGEALVQVHCHQHAVMGFDADAALMRAAGVEVTIPDSGCCGLAGNFGFEDGHYELSQAVGERVILPAVRSAPAGTTVVADGFSCRTQISQGTTRRPVHLAELLAAGLADGGP